jgi:hypothetical protein
MAGRITISTLNNDTGVLATQNGMSGIAKAWANFGWVSSAVTVRASFNVSSVTRLSSQNYQVSFTTAMGTANYCAVANGGTISNGDLESFATSDYLSTSVVVKGAKQVGQGGEDVAIYNVIVML